MNLSLRARLILGAVAVVGLSLILSGILTGVFVQRLERDTETAQLEKAVVNARRAVRLRDVSTLGTDPGGYRVLLLSHDGGITFDSEGTAAGTADVHLGPPHFGAGAVVRDGTVTISGESYQVAATAEGGGRFLALARPASAAVSAATGTLTLRLLLAGIIALAVALILAVALARNVSRPLRELAAAAEDVAAGHYERRVSVSGPPEVGVVGMAFNRMAEAVERARAQQRDFLANVSHELKTPLTSLIGFSQALVDGSLRTKAEQQRAAAIVHEESQRLLRLSQELLELARFESGGVPLRTEPVDLGALLTQELDLVRPRAELKRLAMQLVVMPAVGPVDADPQRLHEILDNLLDNAIKYTPGDTAIQLTAARQGGVVETSVWNAVGAHAPDPERIFERFYRADPAAADAAGAGLGLAISRELAQAMGGTLTAELQDHGLLVRLRLPAS